MITFNREGKPILTEKAAQSGNDGIVVPERKPPAPPVLERAPGKEHGKLGEPS